MFDTKSILEKLHRVRFTYGLSLRDVARESGVSVSTLSRFQRGVGGYDADTLLKLTNWLGVSQISNGQVCDGNTLENVKEAIESDENLTSDNKRRLWRLFCGMYRSLSEENHE